MRITVIGTGYVGLVTGTGFATLGNSVTCVDVDKEKIEKLQKGILPIYEPGLDYHITQNIEESRLKFTTSLKDALKERPEVLFITVGTPPRDDNPKEPDLKYVYSVAEDIGNTLMEYNNNIIVITKSTVPPGTTYKVHDIVQNILKARYENKELSIIPTVNIANNPEFLKEGDALGDFLKPDRIIVGIDDKDQKNSEYVIDTLRELYSPLSRSKDKFIVMSVSSSELTKYAANTMLALRISFMNELSRLVEKVGGDIEDIRKGIGADPRIGNKFLYAGIGYGGSCFPKDVNALISTFYKNDIRPYITEAVDVVNRTQRDLFVQKILNYFKNNLEGKTFAIWGLSFKPNTDDVRESPAIYVLDVLLKHGVRIKAYDPKAVLNMKKIFPEERYNITYYKDQYTPLKHSDGLILLTEWLQFREPDFNIIKQSLSYPLIFDGRNQYSPKRMRELGIDYISVGRPI